MSAMRCSRAAHADVHTLLRLPTGILICSLPRAQPSAFPSHSLLPGNSGLRARREGERPLLRPQTRTGKAMECEPHLHMTLWIYDLRTNLHFTLKEWSSCDID